MKSILLIALVAFSTPLFAQEWLVFDRGENTQVIFNEDNPYSLVSILRHNYDYLHYYVVEGMPLHLVEQLDQKDRQSLIRYKGPESEMPMVDEFGEPVIEELPDGMIAYVYPPADTMFLCLHDLDRIAFTYKDNAVHGLDSLDKIELYKNINDTLQKVGVLDASGVMNMTNWMLPRYLTDEENKTLLQKDGLYDKLRETALNARSDYYRNEDRPNWKYPPHLHFLQGQYVYFSLEETIELSPKAASTYQKYVPWEYYDKVFPMSFDLWDYNLSDDELFEILNARFDSIYWIEVQSDVPMIDDDPNSPNFGMDLMVLVDSVVGIYEYVYPPPQIIYYFIDFDPVFGTTQQIVRDENGDYILKPIMLTCFDELENKPPEFIGGMYLYRDDVLIPELEAQLEILKPKPISEVKDLQALLNTFSNENYVKDLPLDRIETTIVAHKSGKKFAFAKGKHMLTKFIFKEKPVSLRDDYYFEDIGLYKTLNNGVTEIRNEFAEVIYTGDFDGIIPYYDAPEQYAISHEGKWMFLNTTTGKYTNWFDIPNAEIQFGMDGPIAYGGTNAVYIACEDGKCGAIDIEGNIWLPFNYKNIRRLPLVEYNLEYSTIQRNIWFVRDTMDSHWIFLDENGKQLSTWKTGEFLMDYGNVVIFNNGDHVEVFNPILNKEGIEQLHISGNYLELKKSYYPTCVIDTNGKYIVRPDGSEITRFETDSAVLFLVMNKAGMKIIDINGVTISELPGQRYAYMSCSISNYLFVQTDEHYGIMEYDPATNTMKVVHKTIHPKWFSCPKEGDEFIAYYEKDDGTIVYLYADGATREVK